ncbi:M48 family metallopeptidase [Methylocapsa acidiphila]|uniref:M48 family metallopeptidase n=1 Tax=Methylocapsa acidiphila TaxID=133552 RepID=UPI00047E1968|nr:M48 family metallopeptidase [Methylocapsa acidiphila]
MLRLLRRDPSIGEIAYFDISHAGETYRIKLKRVAAARRFTLRVRAGTHEVVLTMPTRGSLAEAKSFAGRNAAWIGARLRRLPAKIGLLPGDCVPLRGVLHQIAHRAVGRGTIWIEPAPRGAEDAGQGGALPLICVNAEASFIPRRVQDYLIREARRDLEGAVARHSKAIGVAPRKMTLRDTASRWGSCSSTGALSFSWRLIMAPQFVLDYLAAHEVAHLKYMNHSAAFWAAVESLSSEVEAAEAWLKANGASLLRFGPGKASAG